MKWRLQTHKAKWWEVSFFFFLRTQTIITSNGCLSVKSFWVSFQLGSFHVGFRWFPTVENVPCKNNRGVSEQPVCLVILILLLLPSSLTWNPVDPAFYCKGPSIRSLWWLLPHQAESSLRPVGLSSAPLPLYWYILSVQHQCLVNKEVAFIPTSYFNPRPPWHPIPQWYVVHRKPF